MGAEDRAASQRIGRATYAVLYGVAESLLAAGTGLVLESNFRRGTSGDELRPLVERSRALFVHCTVSDAERRRRYSVRTRHPGHFDAEQLAGWDPDVRIFGPPKLDGLAVIEADGVAPTKETVAAVRACVDAHTAASRTSSS